MTQIFSLLKVVEGVKLDKVCENVVYKVFWKFILYWKIFASLLARIVKAVVLYVNVVSGKKLPYEEWSCGRMRI